MGAQIVALKPQTGGTAAMPITDEFGRVPCDAVSVPREQRQRRSLYDTKGQFIDTDGLVESVRTHGVLHPIIVDRSFVLIAGERRLTASKLAGLTSVPYRFIDELSEIDAQLIEAEENLKRLDMPWQDEVLALARIHALYHAKHESWSQEKTSKALGMHPNNNRVGIAVRVARELNNPRIAGAETMRAAYNMLLRQDERKIADAMNDLAEGTQAILEIAAPSTVAADNSDEETASGAANIVEPAVVAPKRASEQDSILHTDFLQWAPQYSGPRFNFLHCDFPYGVEVFAGPQSGSDRWEQTYVDTKDLYVRLIKCLGTNLDRLLTPSAHVMFWLSASIERQWETLQLFREVAPSLLFQDFPLVWHKTDNVGILPDAKRGPRRVFETALIASREDRLIVRAVSNAYGAPTAKVSHPSTKPEPVLKHFFSMFVDENTRMLDPTCGSGTALRAAEALGAGTVLGLEVDEAHVRSARSQLRTARNLRELSKS